LTGNSALDADPNSRDKKKRMRKSTASGMEALASSILAYTDTVRMANAVENESLSSGLKKQAINMLEDDIDSPSECALAVSVVASTIDNVNTYLGFKRKETRQAWLALMLKEHLEK
jgi:hypothetical protein